MNTRSLPIPHCPGCKKDASEISSVCQFAREEQVTPEEWVRQEEGTYNRENGHFLCDSCFITEESRLGRRLVGTNGRPWVCP